MEKLGSYKIIRPLSDRLGETSWQVWDDQSVRTVVLRQVREEKAGDEGSMALYAKEQKRLSLHDHHYSTRYLGVEKVNDDSYFVREYVEGRSLAEILAEEPLGRAEFYSLAIQIMQGLRIAHDFGIRHGRLKAENVIVSERGQIRLTETGLPLSSDGSVNLRYRSPELRDNNSTTEAGDIFSAGVLFYQMITGQDPWTDGQVEKIDWILNFESEAGRLIDRDIRLLIEKMISSDPGNRGSNAEEILLSLKVMLSVANEDHPFQTAPKSGVPSRWSARSWMAISVLSMLLIIFWLVLTAVAHQ